MDSIQSTKYETKTKERGTVIDSLMNLIPSDVEGKHTLNGKLFMCVGTLRGMLSASELSLGGNTTMRASSTLSSLTLCKLHVPEHTRLSSCVVQFLNMQSYRMSRW